MKKIFWFVCVLAGIACLVRAQTNSLSGSASEARTATTSNSPPTEVRPTDIESRSGQFYLKTNFFVYRGDVHVDNPQMKLTCELLTIEAPTFAQGKFNRASAYTNVIIDWVDDKGQPNHATSDKAVYTYVLTNTITGADPHWETNAAVVLTGNPVVTNTSGTFRGDPIIWDRMSDTITSPNMVRMTINQNGTNNSPGFFETPAPSPKSGTTPK